MSTLEDIYVAIGKAIEKIKNLEFHNRTLLGELESMRRSVDECNGAESIFCRERSDMRGFGDYDGDYTRDPNARPTHGCKLERGHVGGHTMVGLQYLPIEELNILRKRKP